MDKKEKIVTKAQWIKFYRKWFTSNDEIEVFLNKIADENPTNAQILAKKGAVLVAKGQVKLNNMR